jgi:hypothetical protein
MPFLATYAVEIAYVALAASTATTIYSAVDQAQTARETAKYNSEAANAEAANKDALAAEAIRRERQQNRRKMADLRNNLAQNGTLTTEGTPLAIIGESGANLELGIQDAARAASEQSKSLRAQGAMSLWEGDQQARASYIKAGASALSSFGSGVSGYASGVKLGTIPDTFGLYAPPKAIVVPE